MTRLVKRVADSYTEQVQILTQGTMNGYNRLFGGQLLQWIDIVAAVVARRHSNRNVTTAAIDGLSFSGAAYVNDTLVLKGFIVYTGRTSMEICVQTYIESLSGELNLINTAYFVMVALDENEKPTPVPMLEPVTDEEKRRFEEAQIRRANRK
ncbi:MAG: acyl-CoA thioesterase [Clostridia bacterium]|nr:acyl-CoA thioesterase [Clostridia bacterium]